MIGQTLGGEQRAPRGSAHTERLAQDGSAATGVPAGCASGAALATGATVPLQPGPEHGWPPGAEPAAVPDAAAAATAATTAASATAAAPAPTTASSTSTDS